MKVQNYRMGGVPIGADRDPAPAANLQNRLWVGSRLGAETQLSGKASQLQV